MNYMEKYNLWLERVTDEKLLDELHKMSGDDNAIQESFVRDLEFGTAGLRGILGAGTFRMNIHTVGKATQGLAEYLLDKYDSPSVAIAYDSRINSEVFARFSAGVLAANGIKAYIYSELMPTPMLSFAVRNLKTSAGIVITASHNPSKYNGYKVYGSDGCQMTDEAADLVLEKIENVDIFDGVKSMNFEEGIASGSIEFIGQDVINKFTENVLASSVNPDAARGAGLKVVYTPLNGTGNKPVRNILEKIGVEDVYVVPEQELPDGNFPTAPYPNPEIRQAFECALKLAEEISPDLLLATDPDADRVGIAVRDGNDYRLMTGNEVGCLLIDYILRSRIANGTLPENPVIIKSIVSTPMADIIAESYGVSVCSVLTGFKYIGEKIGELEANGEEHRFIFGFEESYGYMGGSYVRDKDAVVASMLICEMAGFYKKQGLSLAQVCDGLYEKFGMYLNVVSNFAFEGLSGMKKMQSIMENIRENTPSEIAGFKVVSVSDYEKSVRIDLISGESSEIKLPKSNVLIYSLENGCTAIVRPSGTEPKIKTYITAKAPDREKSAELADRITSSLVEILGIK